MKAFGYQKDSEELIELQEVSFQTDIEGLDKLIKFLQKVKEQHIKVIGKSEICHTHFRDWDVDWKADSTDIIVVTTSKVESI